MNNIILEEIQKFLNESYIVNDERFKFNQRLNNSSFNNYDNFTTEFDNKIIGSDIIATWGFSFWLNEFGIENFIVDVEKVEGVFMLQLYDKHTDEMKQETQKNIGEYQWKFIINNANLAKDSSLYISGLSFDFKTQECKVNF